MKARGFTLIEMIIAVGIFAIVMTIALGALLAMSESDRKAQTLKSVINNLSFTMDAMSRSIRTGQTFHCGSGGTLTAPLDCAGSPATAFAFQNSDGDTVLYEHRTAAGDAALCGQPASRVGCITRSIEGGPAAALTSPEVYITSLSFYVNGAQSITVQPKVTILLAGEVSVSATQKSQFNLQTTVTQRLYDQ
jgi:prepilin-type N-terminal cleavage/methylation domain-containing protein